jgi:glycosyltransferase involved in cell wall biosynthesis
MDENRLISAIIPVFNCERYLTAAIESVLRQSYRTVEIIVVDDGSTDRSGEVAESYGDAVTYVSGTHKGIAAARNTGIAAAQGAFFAFLDADDLWHEDKLVLQMKILDERPDLDLVYCHVLQFISPDIAEESARRIRIPQEVMPGYVPATMLIRRRSFARVGPFGETWQIGEFIDWYLRAGEQGLKSLMMREVLLRRRIHDDNVGMRKLACRTDYVKILKSSLDRRRRKQ